MFFERTMSVMVMFFSSVNEIKPVFEEIMKNKLNRLQLLCFVKHLFDQVNSFWRERQNDL